VKDDGTVQPGTTNLEKLQRSISEQINKRNEITCGACTKRIAAAQRNGGR
jgi:tRNA(Ile2) C34 agmatinyltransferase TiaS